MLNEEQIALRGKARAFAREPVEPQRLEASDDPSLLIEMNRFMGKVRILRTYESKSIGNGELEISTLVPQWPEPHVHASAPPGSNLKSYGIVFNA